MSKATRLQALTELTQLRLQADQAKLAAVMVKEIDLRQTLHDLAVQRKQRIGTQLGHGDAGSLAGADLNWQLWVDQRRTAINSELALVLAEKAECTVMLRKSFGQDQAAQQVHRAAQAAARTVALRRLHYES
ncbi:hypothetical protein BC777_2474 [Yoonia maricola]|uniref:Flagellar export protein FliJ n=1 Tax=Yoonia maricola TaxID=420999 RepID=A0A2M8W5C7_9RHOB|nr:hypothetical protein [Yoonia maricola]PJI86116.1 hypothetical protein BC777_2474 [Yoonia maricola]